MAFASVVTGFVTYGREGLPLSSRSLGRQKPPRSFANPPAYGAIAAASYEEDGATHHASVAASIWWVLVVMAMGSCDPVFRSTREASFRSEKPVRERGAIVKEFFQSSIAQSYSAGRRMN